MTDATAGLPPTGNCHGEDAMNKLNAISMDCNLDRGTVLKAAACISPFAVTRPAPGYDSSIHLG
jgi:hypothetical protein